MQFWLIFFTILALVFAQIAVHELGHYLAGLTAGIPSDKMKIRLFTFPQHVALRDCDAWISPVADIEHHINVSRRYISTRGAAFCWVAGGLVVGTTFTTIVCVTAFLFGWTLIAFWIAAISLSMYLVNVLVMDIPRALIQGHSVGDTSGLWTIAKIPTASLTILILSLHIFLIWLSKPQ